MSGEQLLYNRSISVVSNGSMNHDDSILTTSNIFDENGFIRDQGSSRVQSNLPAQRDNWLRSLLNSDNAQPLPSECSTSSKEHEVKLAPSDIGSTNSNLECDFEVASIVQKSNPISKLAISDGNQMRPRSEIATGTVPNVDGNEDRANSVCKDANIAVECETSGRIASGLKAAHKLLHDEGEESIAMLCSGQFLTARSPPPTNDSSSNSNMAIITSGPPKSRDGVVNDCMDEIAMLCSQDFESATPVTQFGRDPGMGGVGSQGGDPAGGSFLIGCGNAMTRSQSSPIVASDSVYNFSNVISGKILYFAL